MKIILALVCTALVSSGRKKGNKNKKKKGKCDPPCEAKFSSCNAATLMCECSHHFVSDATFSENLRCLPNDETAEALVLADQVQGTMEALIASLFGTVVNNPKRRNKVCVYTTCAFFSVDRNIASHSVTTWRRRQHPGI